MMQTTTEPKRPLYECATCGLAVLVVDGQVIRGCACTGAVRANMSATVKGRGLAGIR